MQPALEVGLTLGDKLDRALDLDRDFRFDLLGEVDLVEVHMQEVAIAGTALHLADQCLSNRFVAQLEVDELVAAHLLKRLDELASVHQDRYGIHVVAVDDGRQATLAAKRLEVAAAVGTRLEFERDGSGGCQLESSFGPNWAAPILTQCLAPAERAFSGTFAPFGRY